MSNKPSAIEVAWETEVVPAEEHVAGIIHSNLTALTAELHGEAIHNSWASCLRRSDITGLKTLKVIDNGAARTLPKAISSLSLSQFVANSLTKLHFEFIDFDGARSLEFNKTLQYFVHLRHLSFSVYEFNGPVSQAIKQSFFIDASGESGIKTSVRAAIVTRVVNMSG